MKLKNKDLDKTQYYVPIPPKPACLLILDASDKIRAEKLENGMTVGRETPGSLCDILLKSTITSRRHGEILYDDSDGAFYFIDNNSANGTFINGQRMQPYNTRGSKAYRLSDGDILRIDRSNLNLPHPDSVLMIFSRQFGTDVKWKRAILKGDSILIGRGEECDLRLDDMMASRRHASLTRVEGGWQIRDLNSQCGIGVNQMRVVNAFVGNHDVVRLANTTMIFWNGVVYYNCSDDRSGQLNVHIDRKTVNRGKRTLIQKITFDAESGDFVLILGGSGAGKTTLVNAILGEKKAEGKILLDGRDLYQNFNEMKNQVGLVPQFLTIREADTVRNTLMDTADIKLDGSVYTKADKIKRVNDTMAKVGITMLADNLVGSCSGGQKKKISVANQLIGFQKVFICDEPDSGLDGASRKQQMEVLKEIAENGKIVMVISHEPDDAINRETGESLFTKVLVIAKCSRDNSGHQAFYGTPRQALEYFGVDCLQEITEIINPAHEGGMQRADEFIYRWESMQR